MSDSAPPDGRDGPAPSEREEALRRDRRRFLKKGLRLAAWTTPAILSYFGQKAYAQTSTTCMPTAACNDPVPPGLEMMQ